MASASKDEATRWREHAARELGSAARPMVEVNFDQADDSLRVDLSAFNVAALIECPARATAPPDEFRWKSHLAARRLATMALAAMADRGGDPPGVLRDVIEELGASNDDPLSRWIAGLPAGGRAALACAASSQLVAMRKMLVLWPPTASINPAPLRWRLPRRPVRLSAQATLLARRDGLVHHLALALPGEPGTRKRDDEAAHLALAAALSHGVVPSSVVILWTSADFRETVVVGESLLEGALDRCIEALGHAVAKLEAVAPERRPGPHCGHCPIRGDCPVAVLANNLW
jgi:hypothetical protein